MTAARGPRGALLLVLGAGAAFATSGPLTRYAEPAHPLVIVGGRLVIAALALFALAPRRTVRELKDTSPRQRGGIILGGLLLAAHFGLFVFGLQATSLPAAVALVSLEPVSVVLFAWVLARLRPSVWERLGVLAATTGALLVARGAGEGEHRLLGDLLVIAAAALFGAYVSAARSCRGTLSPGAYAAGVYSVAAAACGLALACLPGPVLLPSPHGLGAIVGLGLVPTLIGHTAVQAAARTLSPSIVAMVSPGETLGSLALGAAWLGELPRPTELLGAAVIVFGVTITLRAGSSDSS